MTERPLTLGTAGHIDHGKTTLVRTLTGRDTDRLKEEKERGISIELGFAELALPSGRLLSVVDVPGHERFVKTMVAGATGIDLFLLVVAADDGVMPQTREHLRIVELLGISAGLVALTKVDIVDDDLTELVRADIEEFLGSTRFAGAPVVAVSGVTGQGLPELLAELDRIGAQVPPRVAYPATRLPVDRVFTLKGIGTVITGTLWSGSISAEDTVAVLPPRTSRAARELRYVRVRSVQVHDRELAEAPGGQRVALSLTGVEREQVGRGQWIVKDPALEPTFLADVRLTLLPDTPQPLPRVLRARVNHGTAEIMAKAVLADRESLEPGESCYAQLRFEDRALVYPGDRFILRSLTPVTTIGGGQVIDPAPRKHSTGPRWHDRLALLEEGTAEAILGLLLEESFPHPLVSGELEASPYLWRFAAPEIRTAAAAMLADRRASTGGCGPTPSSPEAAGDSGAEIPLASDPAAAGRGGRGEDVAAVSATTTNRNARLYHGPSLSALTDAALAELQARAESNPLDPFLTLGELRRDLVGGREAPALEAALESLRVAGGAVRTEHGYRWAGAAPTDDADQGESIKQLLAQFRGAGDSGSVRDSAETPSVTAAAGAAGLAPREARKLVDALVRQGRLVRVGEELHYPPERLEMLMGRLTAEMEAKGQMTLAEARDLLGTSRKYAQALLEHMDSEGLTLRIGEARRLRRRRR